MVDAKEYDPGMKKLLLYILLPLLGACGLEAQKPLGVAWFDFKDARSRTTGLGTLLNNRSGVISLPFDLARPRTLQLYRCDLLIFGSFAELHPRWDDFVRREKEKILAFVRKGGTLVVMCRYRRSDSEGRLSLLPPGFSFKRGKKDIKDDEWYVQYKTEPLWRGFGKDKRNGWNRLPQTHIGPRNLTCGMDAFESWSRNLVRSADLSMNVSPRFHRSYALSGRLGKGHFFFFQLVLDKIDGTLEALGRRQCTLFFDRLLSHVSGWPRVGRQPVTQPGIREQPPRNQPPSQEGPPKRYTLRTRVFWDENGNDRFDEGDRTAQGLVVRVAERRLVTDARGQFEVVLSNNEDYQVALDLPEKAAWNAPWFLNLRAGTARRPVLKRDWALKVRAGTAEDPGRILVASLPGTLSPATLARMELALERILGEEPCSLVVFLSPILDGRRLGDLHRRLLAISSRFKVGLRLLAPAPKRGAAPMRRLLGPPRFGFLRGKRRFLLASESSQASWLKEQAGIDGGKVFAAICAQDPGAQERRELSAAVVHLVLPMLSRDEDVDENGPHPVPIFLMDREDEEEARFAGFRTVDRSLTWFRSSPPVRREPALPVHPLGKGDLDAVLDGQGP